MIQIDLTQDTPIAQNDESQTQHLIHNFKNENGECLEDSFEYVDCDYKFIEQSSNFVEDEQITSTKIILQKNKQIISQLEDQEIVFQKIYESSTEIRSLENELNALEQSISNVFYRDDYNLHMIKQHDINKFQDLGNFIDYFYFYYLHLLFMMDGIHFTVCN
ncbi:hypothetical protein ABPG72_016609, partial [Tetrahymena utriculariae]